MCPDLWADDGFAKLCSSPHKVWLYQCFRRCMGSLQITCHLCSNELPGWVVCVLVSGRTLLCAANRCSYQHISAYESFICCDCTPVHCALLEAHAAACRC